MNCKQRTRLEAELAVCGELGHVQHGADLQAARPLQGQGRVARLGEALAERAQQRPTVGVVEGQTSRLVIQERPHSLGHLNHKHAGLDAVVQQLIGAAGGEKGTRVVTKVFDGRRWKTGGEMLIQTLMVWGCTANTMTDCSPPAGCFCWLRCRPRRACRPRSGRQRSPSSDGLVAAAARPGWMDTWKTHSL